MKDYMKPEAELIALMAAEATTTQLAEEEGEKPVGGTMGVESSVFG
jgi:hypothetical protein